MSEIQLSNLRLSIKENILHYLADDWNNYKRGKAHILNDLNFVSLEDEVKIRNLFTGIAEQLKEQT